MNETIETIRNVAHDPLDVYHISLMYVCAARRCTRMVIEYDDGTSTKHSRGLAYSTLSLARNNGAPLVEVSCDHHGGGVYTAEPETVRPRLTSADEALLRFAPPSASGTPVRAAF